jgi:GT2 family glycosyltransferase
MPSPYESESAITDSLFASGAAFLVRKRWLDKIGGLFDPYYCAYGEDLELSLRTILLGGEIGYVRESRIYHYVGGAGLPPSRASYLSTRNILLTYYKLLELKNFTRIFLVQMAYIVARLFARKQQLSNTINMMKGVIGFLSSFPRYTGYRRIFASNKKRDDKYIFERFLYRGKMEKLILKRGIYRS